MSSSTSLCRLCICSYNECKSLYDDDGECNETYKIAVKYFDQIIIKAQHYPQLAMAICTQCWQYIQDFHTYQHTVLEAHIQLEKDSKQLMKQVIKIEDELVLDSAAETMISTTAAQEILNDVFNNMDMEEKSAILLPDFDLSDTKDDNPFSTDDEKPLINRLPRKKYTKKKLEKEDSDADKNEKPVKKRVRKPKSKTTSKKSKTISKRNENPEAQDKIENVDTAQLEEIPLMKENEEELKDDEDENEQDSNVSSNDEGGNDYDTDENQLDADNDKRKMGKEKMKEIDDFIAEWKKELECIVCNTFHSNFSLLRKHFRQEHPNEKCFVSCCQRKLQHRCLIVEHIRLHLNPDAFKCEICGKCSSNTRNLTKHIKEKHTAEGLQRRFECTICSKRFAKKCTLKSHMETHETGRDYQCKECGKGFSTDQRRKVHERMVHNVDRICDQCGKTIHGIYALRQHVLEHAGVQKRKWPCDQCNAELNSHSSLKRHKSVAHHDGSTVYVCSECGKIAPTETALRSHKKYVHQSERKFKCTICDKGFKVAIVLREHMATHTGEDLYKCPHCPKTFKVNANMHHHRKKAHPKEWAEARINKPIITKVDVNLVSNEVVI